MSGLVACQKPIYMEKTTSLMNDNDVDVVVQLNATQKTACAAPSAAFQTSSHNNNGDDDDDENDHHRLATQLDAYQSHSNNNKHLVSSNENLHKLDNDLQNICKVDQTSTDENITISLASPKECLTLQSILNNERLNDDDDDDENNHKTNFNTSKPAEIERIVINQLANNSKISNNCQTIFQHQTKPNWVSKITLNSNSTSSINLNNINNNNNNSITNATLKDDSVSLTKNSLESINSKLSDTSVLISSDLSLASSTPVQTDTAINSNNNNNSSQKQNNSNSKQEARILQSTISDDCNINQKSNSELKTIKQQQISGLHCSVSMENVLNPSLLEQANAANNNPSGGIKLAKSNQVLVDQVRFNGHHDIIMSKSQNNNHNNLTSDSNCPDNDNNNPFDDDHGDDDDKKTNKDHISVKFKANNNENRRPSSAAQRRASMCRVKPPFPFAGILAAMSSSVFFSLSSLMIKLLPDSDEGEGLQEKLKAMLTRGSIITVICAITICLTGSTFKIKRDEIWVNFARAMVGSMGVMSLFCSLEYISLGDATALMFSSPIWTYLLSHFIFAEPLHWILIFLLPLGVVGIILISHPTLIVPLNHLSLNHPDTNFIEQGSSIAAAALSETPLQIASSPILQQTNESLALIQDMLYNATSTTIATISDTLNNNNNDISNEVQLEQADHLNERWPGIVISLAGSVAVSLTYIVLKFRKSTPIQTTTFWFGLGQMSISIIAMCFIGFGQIPKSYLEWSLLVANGILSWLGQCVLQWSFAYEDAGVLSIVRTGDVAVCFLLSALFLDDDIYWTSIVGSLILGLVVALIIVNNWIYKSCHPNEDAHLMYADHDLSPTKSLPSKHELRNEFKS